MSSFNGQDLFSSGPHRFVYDVTGRLYLPPLAGANQDFATADYGPLELSVIQTGRLIADDDAGLIALIDAVRAVAESDDHGTLVDATGRSLTGMSMLRFTLTSTIDRGRVHSAPYEILYRQLLFP